MSDEKKESLLDKLKREGKVGTSDLGDIDFTPSAPIDFSKLAEYAAGKDPTETSDEPTTPEPEKKRILSTYELAMQKADALLAGDDSSTDDAPLDERVDVQGATAASASRVPTRDDIIAQRLAEMGMQETKKKDPAGLVRYLIISDCHEDPHQIGRAIKVAKHLYGKDIDFIVALGDLMEMSESLDVAEQHFAIGVNYMAQSDIPSILIPGSHDMINIWESVIGHFKSYNGNIMNGMDVRGLDVKGNHSRFIPGSGVNSRGGQYKLVSDAMPTGYYIHGMGADAVPVGTLDAAMKIKAQNPKLKIMYHSNLNDIGKLTQGADLERTVVWCHDPPRCKGKHAVDYTHFVQQAGGGVAPSDDIESGIESAIDAMGLRGQIEEATDTLEEYEGRNPQATYKLKRELIKAQSGGALDLVHGNAGVIAYAKLKEDHGVQWTVNGHIHSRAGTAHTNEGKPLEYGEVSSNGAFNASLMDAGKFGILEQHGEDVKVYTHNINDYKSAL